MTRTIITFLCLASLWTNLDGQTHTYTADPSSVLPDKHWLQDRRNVEYLFSASGDTLIWPADPYFYIVRIQNNSFVDLDSFKVAPKSGRVTSNDYPNKLIKKYHLVKKGSLVNPDSLNSLRMDVVILNHLQLEKSFWPELNFYHLDLAVSINFCNQNLLDKYNFKVEYDSDEKKSDIKLHKSELIDILVKIDGKDEYFFIIDIIECWFNFDNKKKECKSVYFTDNFIRCH